MTLGKSSVNVAKDATATYTVVLDAYPTGDVTVTPASSATGTATVSGALTFTQSNWNTTQSVTVTSVAAGSATISHTVAGGGYGSVSVSSVSVTVPATGVCTRTTEVRDAIVAAVAGKSACANITATDLAGITTLTISNKATLTTLKSDDFDDLVNLTSLTLTGTGVSSLPAGVFDDPAKLTTLTLTGNSLSSLSASVFDKLTRLTTLSLTNNSLSTLPAGIFDKLTALTSLSLNQNTSLTCLPFIPASVPDSNLNLDEARSTYSACGAAVTLGKSSVNAVRGATATYTVVLDAYPTGDVTVTPASSATAKATVSGALTFTQSNWNTTQSVTVTGVAYGSATISHTIAGGGYGSVSAGSVSVTVTATDVCTRTTEVRDAIVAAVAGKSACGAITPTDLVGITTLAISNKATLTTLKSDDFGGLTNLTSLTLNNTGVSSLPAGVFNDLAKLTTLTLTGNALSSLSASIFDKLTKLTTLSLTNNSLSSLPVGIFDKLTALTTLDLNQATPALTCLPFIPASVTTLSLDKAKTAYAACGAAVTLGKTSVTVAKGATATYTVVLAAYPTGDVTVTPASSATGTATVSGALTFTQSNWSTTQTVTVTAVAAGSATISHTIAGGGYGSVSAGSVSVTVPATDVCTRTAEVRDEIVDAVSGKSDCADITPTDLAGITTLGVTNQSSLTTLKSDDFADLTGLTTLHLHDNALSALPAGVFDDLTGLTQLLLKANALSSLPAGVFDKLTSLTTLGLYDNALSALPAGVFDKLASLTELTLYDNALSSLPAGVFDKLTSLSVLYLNDNSLSALSAGVFDKPTSLTKLYLNDNALSALPAGVLDKLTGLTTLDLKGNASLACLPLIPSTVTTLRLDKNRSAYAACGAAVTLGASSLTVTKGTTATYTVVLDAYPTGTVTVTPASSATGKATVSGALYFGKGNWNTTQSVTVTGVAAGSATISHTIAGGGYGSVSVGSVSVSVPVTDTCIRTPQVRDAIVAAVSGKSACGAITTADLAGITTLSVTNEATLTTLKPGDFSGLTNLTSLTLSSTGLASLPAVVFTELTKLTTLTLSNNSLSSLPADVFDALTVLTTLDLRGNSALACLPVIPASVTTLQLDKARSAYDVCGAALTLGASSVTVTRDTTATYTVVLAEPPTGDVTVTPASSATAKVTVSGALTFTTGNWNSTQTVTLTGVAAGTATISHTTGGGGYDNASAGSVTAKVPETDLCIRTSLVRDAVVAAVSGKTTCGAITPADLAGMTTLSVTNESALTTLKSGDFAGLTGLTTLTLSSNGLSSLPAGVFDKLTGLTTLTLSNNGLSSLPAGVFDKLTELTTLDLGSNTLSSLPAGVFDKLTKLTTLTLSDNALSSLPAGVFDNLTKLTTLSLLVNSLSSLPAGVFDNLAELTTLTLDSNALSSLPAGVFDNLTRLTTLTLGGNGLSSLPAGVFDKLTKLNMLVLSDNALSSLPAGVFDKLTELKVLDLSDNSLSTVPAGVFDKLTELTVLDLSHNSLDGVPAGVFDNLYSLMALYLDGNASMTCLPYIPSQAFWTCPSCTPPDGPATDFAACGAAVTVFPTEVTMPKDATALYSVVLEAYPRGDVLVTPASGATTIATVPDDGALTFTDGNWNIPQTVTVTGVARGETTISHTVGGGGYDNTTAADVKATVTETGEVTGPGGPGPGTGDDCDCKPSLSASDVGLTTAILTLTGHDAAWWIKGEQSGASCMAVAAGATVTRPSGLTPGTAYTYTAYADDGCTDELATTTFTTLDADLTLRRVTLVEGSTAQYTISLTQAPSGDVTVTVSNPDEGAVTVSPLVLAFTPGNWNTPQPVTLNAVQDPDTADETVTLTHTASGGGYTGESTTFTTIATVTDDDVPALILSPTSTHLVEGGEAATYTVALATLPTAPVTVTVGNPDEGAVTVGPAVLTFTPGNWNTAQPLRLGALQDPDTMDETVTLAHTASGGGYDGVGADFTATVTDDDVPALILSPPSATLAEGGEAATYTVALTKPPTAPVTVTVSNPDKGAVTVSPTVLRFTPDDWNTAQTVTLRAARDPDAIDETVTLAHTASGGGYDGVGADFTATVTDDSDPALILSPTRATLAEGGGTATWTVALATLPTAPVTVTLGNPDQGAVTVSPVVLTFTPDDWHRAQTVRLGAVQDPDTIDETVTLAHTASGGGYDGVGADFAATVKDDDVPALILSPTSATLVDGGEAATYTVALATLPTAPVTVTLGNPDEGAVTVSPTVLMFTPGDWHTAQTVTVSAVQDPDTINETVTLAHTAFGGGYDGVGADFTATVKDDGVPALILSPTSATLPRAGVRLPGRWRWRRCPPRPCR